VREGRREELTSGITVQTTESMSQIDAFRRRRVSKWVGAERLTFAGLLRSMAGGLGPEETRRRG
jgi:hypothetical protein